LSCVAAIALLLRGLRTSLRRYGCSAAFLSALRRRIRFNVAEETFHFMNHFVLHYAHMVVDRQVQPFKNRNNFLAAHI